ncbi:hypothetical protein BGZ46_002931, partial [Entomortierella lignicola]
MSSAPSLHLQLSPEEYGDTSFICSSSSPSSSSSSTSLRPNIVPYRAKRQRQNYLFSALSALALTLAFVGSSGNNMNNSIGVAMGLPVGSINVDHHRQQQQQQQRVFMRSEVYTAQHQDQITQGRLFSQERSSVKKSHHYSKSGNHGDNDDDEKKNKPHLDKYQERFLDFASRVSGKDRKQVETIVHQQDIENNNPKQWLSLYKERDERERRRIKAQEMRDDQGIFAHYVGGLKAHGYGNGRGKESDHGLARGAFRMEQVQEGVHTTVVKNAWVPDDDQQSQEFVNDNIMNMRKKEKEGPFGYKQVPKSTPTIFYIPHQDDDALAMALSIREHVESGYRVIVHLYSDGVNSLLRDIVAGDAPCTLQHTPAHKLNLTLEDVVTGRTHEFRNSLRALGVKDEDIFETGWSDVEPYLNYEMFKKKLHDLIIGYEEK